jgi:hypothetical protein
LALISKNIIDENILALKILFLHLYRKKYEWKNISTHIKNNIDEKIVSKEIFY